MARALKNSARRGLCAGVAAMIVASSADVLAAERPCVAGTTDVRELIRRSDQAHIAKDYLGAAKLREEASWTYPICLLPSGLDQRISQIEYALNGYKLAQATFKADPGKCEDPSLLAAQMLIRHHEALMRSTAIGTARWLEEIGTKLREWNEVILKAAYIREGVLRPMVKGKLEDVRADYTAMVRRLPGCAGELSGYLVETVKLSISPSTTAPSCAASDEYARRELSQVLTAIKSADPQSAQVSELQALLDSYNSRGADVEASQARAAEAAANGDHATAVTANVHVLSVLPECATYRVARADALAGALQALKKIGDGLARQQASALVEASQQAWLSAYGETKGYEVLAAQLQRLFPEAPRADEVRPDPQALTTDRRARRRGLVAGFGVGVGVTASLFITGVALTARLRRGGPVYQEIIDTYEEAGENPYVDADLCDPATGDYNLRISLACGRHASGKKAAMAVWSVTAIAAVATAVVGTLLARSKRSSGQRRVNVGVAPGRTGFMVSGTLRF